MFFFLLFLGKNIKNALSSKKNQQMHSGKYLPTKEKYYNILIYMLYCGKMSTMKNCSAALIC